MEQHTYLENILHLPIPSRRQCKQFAEDLCVAKAWYKDLSLLEGGEFLIFLAEDAGSHFGLPSKTHRGWSSQTEYQRRYGYLDFLYRPHRGSAFSRGSGGEDIPPGSLPLDLLLRGGFHLYPYCSKEYQALTSIQSPRYQRSLQQLQNGYLHPERQTILEWAEQVLDNEHTQTKLTDDEQQCLQQLEYELFRRQQLGAASPFSQQSPTLRDLVQELELQRGAWFRPQFWDYLHANEALHKVYNSLQQGEFQRIQRHLDAIVDWMHELQDTQPSSIFFDAVWVD